MKDQMAKASEPTAAVQRKTETAAPVTAEQGFGGVYGGYSPELIMQLQKSAGNRAVNQLLASRSAGSVLGGLEGSSPPSQLAKEAEPNRTGMPDSLKSGLETMSGMDLSDVSVHYNSSRPAELQAHAYAQGNDIHIAPGQEQHLPHEGWHVVQQRQGRVRPTTQLKGAAINDNSALEQEADQMGAQASRLGTASHTLSESANRAASSAAIPQRKSFGPLPVASADAPIQRALVRDQEVIDERGDTFRWGKFKGKRDDVDPTHSAIEEGRGTTLTTGVDAKTKAQWSPIDGLAGEGKRVEALVGPDHNLGTSPSHANAEARVNAFKALSGKSYISGHLLNEKLGGPGNDPRNLTAISGSANTLQSSNIEKLVRDPVNEDGDWYKYIVDVQYKDDSTVMKDSNPKLQAYDKLAKKPTGVVITDLGGKKKIDVRYASKLTANWYQVNTKGGRYGAEFKKNLNMDSPLAGGKSSMAEKKGEGEIAVKPDKKTRGKAARTDIDAEELVLTTSNLLKTVIENREGLIERLNEVRGSNKELAELVKELETLVDQGEGESIELRDIVYDYGYDWGYDHGKAAYNDNVDYYEDDGNNGAYSEGYAKGYEQGNFDARQYELGHSHGREDGYYESGYTEYEKYNDMHDNQSYRGGYEAGDADGRYDYWYERGEQDGYRDGLEDQEWHLVSQEEGYLEGYEKSYADGLKESPFAKGKRPICENIKLTYDANEANQFKYTEFDGTTVVSLTGESDYFNNEKWYEVEVMFSTHHILQNYIKNNKFAKALMHKDWIREGK
ncbi:eCIS core domain-containing protein [Paenibacillus harenae]|uniref:DUF4157 domain-containing protein n=1 Tax=Paenibacillus harenae TaxID=306543 RepID=A0ABT9U347_PAEHA|nr:DUF4157 domain-containing protein [Paenibacillus harenae]MDQ0114061.1 hypothetical protein [Paenibacillus harenae]